ncbi:hypothetical protein AMJ49_02385 [Parcubacteria bacterium DG_74_2]|nr:MAG: hypothetical protein AMJ49_02385 [Parcubacteria bacterium DG_74_2]
MKFPSKNQWKQFFKILDKKEKISFFICFFLFSISLTFLSVSSYFKNTKIVPAKGGGYVEGVLGSPRWINPIYSPSNDADRDLVELIFSGLLRYGENGIEKDLVQDYKVLDEGKTYEFSLKENIFWSDGKPLTVDDVIFTIKAIQGSETRSPLRPSWLGIDTEKVSEKVLRFKLKESSATFLENVTLKIIPKHIWEEVPLKDFSLSIWNLKPIGSGPYVLENLIIDKEGQIKSLDLVINKKYFGQKPYIPKITFKFFEKKEDLIESYEKGEIMGFNLPWEKDFDQELVLYSFSSPRYFAIFFNTKESKILNSKTVRQALSYSIDKKEILKKFLGGSKAVDSPILPEIYDFKAPSKIYEFDFEKAMAMLDEEGFKEEDGKRIKVLKIEPGFEFKSDLKLGSEGKEVTELQKCLSQFPEIYPEGQITGYFGPKTREAVIKFQEKYSEEILKPFDLKKGTGDVRKTTRKKLNEVCFLRKEEKIPLKLSLATVNESPLIDIAKNLKEQWEEIGIEVEVKIYDQNTILEKVIKPRDYELLLFGEALGKIPDPFPFWHSSQTIDPGLNLSLYEKKDCDKLLEEARKSLDEKERKENLEKFQDVLIEDAPALFLFRGDYFYFVSNKIKGIQEKIILDPSQRFLGIENWYIREKRVWK